MAALMCARLMDVVACHDGATALCGYYHLYIHRQHMWLCSASILLVLLECCHRYVFHAPVHLDAVLPALHDVRPVFGYHISVVVLGHGPEYRQMWGMPQAAQAPWHGYTPVWLMMQLDYLPQ